MKLVVVSHTPHYWRGTQLVGWGATIREIDQLSRLFDEIVHVAPLHTELADGSALPYASSRVQVSLVPCSGGPSLGDKLAIVKMLPAYIRTILNAIKEADVVHVRCPAGISAIAIILLAISRSRAKRWVKYAGDWQDQNVPLSYAFQRWWLKRGQHRGVVTVNGNWPVQPEHVVPFLNPCLLEEEIAEAGTIAATKSLGIPVRLIFAGRLEAAKGAGLVIDIVARLHCAGVRVVADIAGDGPDLASIRQRALDLGLGDSVIFHGWLPRHAIAPLYAGAHFMLLPSRTEGWPKVISEAMAYGVVPVAGAVGSIPQYFDRFQCGRAVDPRDAGGFADAIRSYVVAPALWQRQSQVAVLAAKRFTYDEYLRAVSELLNLTDRKLMAISETYACAR